MFCMVASRVGGKRPHAPKSPVATIASWDLEATVKQIVDGATKGDGRATRLLFALIKADERALSESEGGRPEGLASEADAIVIAELRRRFAGDGLSRTQRSGPVPHPQAGRGEPFPLRGKAAGGSPLDEGSRRPSPQPSPRKRGEGEERRPS